MHRCLLPTLLAACLLPVGCATEDGLRADLPAAQTYGGSPALEGELPRGMYAVMRPEHQLSTASPTLPGTIRAGAPILVFMNRGGGTYTVGANDARQNRTSVPDTNATIPPWQVSDAGWNQVMSCMREIWAPYNVVFTDQDPGNVPHYESVVAGHPNDLGFPNGVGGVSPFTNNCSVIDNSIVFTFAEVYGTNYRAICETAAQEVAHSFGLDHEYLCEDPMTYLGGCGAKTFRNTDAPCGEDGPRPCACGASTQNSVQMLLERIGPADEIAPTVTIARPQSGQTVNPNFIVQANVNASITIERVELWIDGALADTVATEPYLFNAPADLAGGQHSIETRAIDNLGNTGSANITITLSADGTAPDPDNGTGGGANGTSPDLVGGCTVGGADGSTAWLLIGLGLAFATARRRRR